MRRLAISVVSFGVLLAGSVPAQPLPVERVPESAVIDGRPQGIFVGRSLLTGRAVCLLFLSGGRVTRFIPAGGLEAFDWARHRKEHDSDSGRWELTDEKLKINWGDGGTHEGPLRVRPTGIEFYGKRYSRPATATIADLVGQWESARGMALVGGEGINTLNHLVVDPDGRYRWNSSGGGHVAGRVASSRSSTSGHVKVVGHTVTFTANDGTVTTHTLLPVPGDPLTAFTLDANLFTRPN